MRRPSHLSTITIKTPISQFNIRRQITARLRLAFCDGVSSPIQWTVEIRYFSISPEVSSRHRVPHQASNEDCQVVCVEHLIDWLKEQERLHTEDTLKA